MWNHKSSQGNKFSGYSQVPPLPFLWSPFTQSQSGAESYRIHSREWPPWYPAQASITPAWTVNSTSQVTRTSRPHSSTSSRNVSQVAQVCPTPCDPMDCSPPGFSVHGILQARILERVAISFSRGIFPSRASNPGLLHCRQILYYLSHIIHITSPWDTDSSSSAWLAFIPPPHWACFTLWIEADIIFYSLFVSCVSPLKT